MKKIQVKARAPPYTICKRPRYDSASLFSGGRFFENMEEI